MKRCLHERVTKSALKIEGITFYLPCPQKYPYHPSQLVLILALLSEALALVPLENVCTPLPQPTLNTHWQGSPFWVGQGLCMGRWILENVWPLGSGLTAYSKVLAPLCPRHIQVPPVANSVSEPRFDHPGEWDSK